MTSRTIAILSLAAAAAIAQPKDLDLFLLIGQSNMAGRGALDDAAKTPSKDVWMLNKEMQWVPAVDPMHFDRPALIGVGLGRSFADTLRRAAPNAKIGLIPAAMGGSALDEWIPEGELYKNAVARARKAMASGKLRAILWHQGEADSVDPAKAASYRARWTPWIARLRADLGVENLPVVIGQLGEFLYSRPNNESRHARTVNEQLATLVVSVPRVAIAPAGGLTHKGDHVHFDTASFREFGRRYAHAYLQLDPNWSR
jgi:hypothetical protein